MEPTSARILIVENETTYRGLMRKFLARKRTDWVFDEAGNERKGLKLLKSQLASGEPISVLITDLVMGPTFQEGLQLLKEARVQDPLLEVILYSREPEKLDPIRFGAFGIGAFEVIDIGKHGEKAFDEILIKAEAALRHREVTRQNDLLRRYFSQKLLNAIEKNPELLKPRQLTATVCFWDIRKFSAFCESLKAHPEVIAGFLKEYCDAAARIIFKHDGMLDKYIGDGVMALFGILDESKGEEGVELASANAVNAALELRTEFKTILKKWEDRIEKSAPNWIPIGLGCGIHTDSTFVGNLGTAYRDQFTALGPTVNIASRLQGESEAGQIIVSRSTRSWVRSEFRLRFLRNIDDIKNIPGVFPIYEVKGRGTPTDRGKKENLPDGND
jgi:class 3 adenylate cyclase